MSHLPDVRRIFIPDPDHIIVEADLAGAEARVVAWECGGQFKADFIANVKIHVETMKRFHPQQYAIDPKFEPHYTKCKNMAYGTIYVGSPPGIGSAAAIPVSLVRAFQAYFFDRYPEIKIWHRRVEASLMLTREVNNPFGYRIHFFDRPEALLPEAVNWIAQSTIGIVCQRGTLILLNEFHSTVQLLLQVHDSIVFQVHRSVISVLPRVKARLDSIPIPYPDPLCIPWDFKASPTSWGDCKPIDWGKFDGVSLPS